MADQKEPNKEGKCKEKVPIKLGGAWSPIPAKGPESKHLSHTLQQLHHLGSDEPQAGISEESHHLTNCMLQFKVEDMEMRDKLEGKINEM